MPWCVRAPSSETHGLMKTSILIRWPSSEAHRLMKSQLEFAGSFGSNQSTRLSSLTAPLLVYKACPLSLLSSHLPSHRRSPYLQSPPSVSIYISLYLHRFTLHRPSSRPAGRTTHRWTLLLHPAPLSLHFLHQLPGQAVITFTLPSTRRQKVMAPNTFFGGDGNNRATTPGDGADEEGYSSAAPNTSATAVRNRQPDNGSASGRQQARPRTAGGEKPAAQSLPPGNANAPGRPATASPVYGQQHPSSNQSHASQQAFQPSAHEGRPTPPEAPRPRRLPTPDLEPYPTSRFFPTESQLRQAKQELQPDQQRQRQQQAQAQAQAQAQHRRKQHQHGQPQQGEDTAAKMHRQGR